MNILVVGCGKVGSQLSNILSSMGHDTAVIDPDPASFERLSDDFRGYTVAGVPIDQTVLRSGGIFSIDFTKAPCEPCAAANAVISQGSPSGKWSVFVGREIIGDGDPELGASLMKMFFYTLTQSDDLPASILFMNGGVKLPVHNEQIAGHLRELSSKGVEILVCGTCLNFYHLAEQLQVGTVSNMYEIVERMKQAGKVISL